MGTSGDLQRRSILETLATNLINNEVFQGAVKIQMRNGKEHEASWKDQLTLLLSNKQRLFESQLHVLLLPLLGSNMDSNTASGLMQHSSSLSARM